MRSDDEVLVSRCLEGDQPAFAFLVNKYKEVVHAYAYRKVGNYQQAEDITQEVFIKAYRKLAQLKWPHRFQSWLYAITANECKMWLRKHSDGSEREVSWEDVPAVELNKLAMRSHGDEDIKLTVKNAMETLSDDSQLAVSLYYMSSLSIKEIAHFMGISPGNVRVKLHRARKQLGERLEKMLGKHLRKEKLKAGFVFKMTQIIRDMPIPSLPKSSTTRWVPIPIAIGVALLIGVIGLGMSSDKDALSDIPMLKPIEKTVAVSLLTELDEQGILDSGKNELIALNTAGNVSAEEVGRGTGIEIRRVRVPQPLDSRPSPDGRYVCMLNWETRNLAIRDLTTGEQRDITTNRPESDGRWAVSYVWSPDSKQLAYQWSETDIGTFGGHDELRIIGLDGSEERVLYSNDEVNIQPHDWSRDGRSILAWFRRINNSSEIVLVSVVDGSVHALKSLESDAPMKMSLSPDGRYVAYDRPMKEHIGLRDIFLLATDGSSEVPLEKNPGDDYCPLWTPDGKGVVFASNRDPGGSTGLWLAQVADGKPMGKPQLIRREAGDIYPLGFTKKGVLYYVTVTGSSEIYTAPVDLAAGKLLSSPKLLRSRGSNNRFDWSPDGKSLAFVSRRVSAEGTGRRPILVIRSMDTGGEREIPLEPRMVNGYYWAGTTTRGHVCWSPDGRFIVYGGSRARGGLNLINVKTGDIKLIAQRDPKTGSPVYAEWSADGKTIFYIRVWESGEEPSHIMAYDVETGKEWEFYPRESSEYHSIWPVLASPDSQRLIFKEKGKGVLMISTEGGEPHTLFDQQAIAKLEKSGLSGPYGWMPDGRHLLFAKQGNPDQLWQIPVEGGEPQKLLELKDSIKWWRAQLNPDGRRIAFYKYEPGQSDLWIMKNFLPKSTASR